MTTVVTAEAPALLVCSHCQVKMSAPPSGMRADVLVMAALRFIALHEANDGTPTKRLSDGVTTRPHE